MVCKSALHIACEERKGAAVRALLDHAKKSFTPADLQARAAGAAPSIAGGGQPRAAVWLFAWSAWMAAPSCLLHWNCLQPAWWMLLPAGSRLPGASFSIFTTLSRFLPSCAAKQAYVNRPTSE